MPHVLDFSHTLHAQSLTDLTQSWTCKDAAAGANSYMPDPTHMGMWWNFNYSFEIYQNFAMANEPNVRHGIFNVHASKPHTRDHDV